MAVRNSLTTIHTWAHLALETQTKAGLTNYPTSGLNGSETQFEWT